MQIIVLGSGTCVPMLERNSPGYLLIEDGERFLLDCGPGIIRRLTELNVKITEISEILLTHAHLDHSGDLCSFLFASKYSGLQRDKELTIRGPEGFVEFFHGLRKIYGEWILPASFKLNVKECNAETFMLGSLAVHPHALPHSRAAVGYRIEDSSGKVFVYTGDTDYGEEVIELCRGADLAVCECSFPDGQKVEGHLTPSLAGKIATAAGVKKLVLSHFYPPCDEVDVLAQAAQQFKGETVLAYDLMELFV